MTTRDTFEQWTAAEDFDALLSLGNEVTYESGRHLMWQGDVADCVMVLRSGYVQVLDRGDDGLRRVLGFRKRGELLGELAYFGDGRRTASVIAYGLVTVVKIPGRRFQAFLDRHPRVYQAIVRMLALRLHTVERRRAGKAVARVLRELVDLAQAFSDDRDRKVVLPVTQEVLGQLADMSYPSAQRAVRALRRRNLLDPGSRKLTVPCQGCLRRAAQAPPDYGNPINGCGGSPTCPQRVGT
ncbi:Crp/Fnr family transcriptional regulator [Saccharothrix violaceirubra]|uniref:CRP-like cAMP-binding protein n=1 Tax=Saccharothrix violaceirubra TaxID=413306 RepID=A0A7W7T8M5_9PSEU|nr:Crp/Fnr family transcriptional regulator [Saccharothrix violaceirubra]MBB4968589.1 CRP-like cAMP-binding protein [Saccharothrix violaceirubra]